MHIVYLIVLLPFLGFLFLSFSQGKWSERSAALIGVGSIGLSTLLTVYLIFSFYYINNDYVHSVCIKLWTWTLLHDLSVPISFRIDALSLNMLFVVVFVGFFVHLYSSWYMKNDIGYSRFFSYMNLFIANMIILVLSDNFLLMYLGWEGVGLCSYLLIGFYHQKIENLQAAFKAFIVTRIGDVMFIGAVLILYHRFGTLNFHEITLLTSEIFNDDLIYVQYITLMLLVGAIGKSAQIPLHTWLTDAMVAPAPVSALIHAATMVTSGVYLIARMHSLFTLCPNILNIISIIGGITLILAGVLALMHTDIKKILAYSTMSQVGYMFLSLGLQGWQEAISHLMVHAFFKALLFLAAGSLYILCKHRQNIFRMGRALYKSLPFLYICFLVGGSSLSALPFLTSGFYSKEGILYVICTHGNIVFIIMGLLGACITYIYTFRMIFFVFHGKSKVSIYTKGNLSSNLSLIVLLILSTSVGTYFKFPLSEVLPMFTNVGYLDNKLFFELVSSIISIFGILLIMILYFFPHYRLFLRLQYIFRKNSYLILLFSNIFDFFYKKFFVKPYLFFIALLVNDPLGIIIKHFSSIFVFFSNYLFVNLNYQIRWYILSMIIGALMILSILVLFSL